jgi:hypothetical protein
LIYQGLLITFAVSDYSFDSIATLMPVVPLTSLSLLDLSHFALYTTY